MSFFIHAVGSKTSNKVKGNIVVLEWYNLSIKKAFLLRQVLDVETEDLSVIFGSNLDKNTGCVKSIKKPPPSLVFESLYFQSINVAV